MLFRSQAVSPNAVELLGASLTITPADTQGPVIQDIRFVSTQKEIVSIVLEVSEELNRVGVADVHNYVIVMPGKDKKFGTGDDTRLLPKSASYDAASLTITLTPANPLKLDQFVQVGVNGFDKLTDLAGNPLDGNRDGVPGGDFSAIVGRGTKLSYTDGNGDTVSLTLSKGGTMDVLLGPKGDAQHVRLNGTTPGSALTGTVTKGKKQGDGATHLDLISGAAGVKFNLPKPAFQIGRVRSDAVDLLLEADALSGLLMQE